MAVHSGGCTALPGVRRSGRGHHFVALNDEIERAWKVVDPLIGLVSNSPSVRRRYNVDQIRMSQLPASLRRKTRLFGARRSGSLGPRVVQKAQETVAGDGDWTQTCAPSRRCTQPRKHLKKASRRPCRPGRDKALPPRDHPTEPPRIAFRARAFATFTPLIQNMSRAFETSPPLTRSSGGQ